MLLSSSEEERKCKSCVKQSTNFSGEERTLLVAAVARLEWCDAPKTHRKKKCEILIKYQLEKYEIKCSRGG
jgi:hypothetical protein